MSTNASSMLADSVRIRRHYQRSIRLDADLGRQDALDGYICHRTATTVLETMAQQIAGSNQRAFTWTGPFGGGKSSLAVALASALSTDQALRKKARRTLQLSKLPAFDKACPAKRGWLIVPVVGKRASVSEAISEALDQALGTKRRGRKPAPSTVISNLCALSADDRFDGVLLIIDEMGKFLEASALGVGDDVYFFQELAEAAARSQGRFVSIGILHQSFRQYAAKLGTDSQDDWAKVQGRFTDIPLLTGSDEIVELIGQAIDANSTPKDTRKAANTVAASMRKRRPTVGDGFAESLRACWPLHPTMAALIGPISKRQFGQNERSAFGFLASVEPHGFQAFLHSQPSAGTSWYRPSNYWDYLRANLEPAILSSPDGHRWAQAADAVERVESKGASAMQIALIKSIAVIDLFRNGSGLAAEDAILLSLFDSNQAEEVKSALRQLAKWRVVLFKKHIGAWSVFEGSDFDIEAAISEARGSISGVDFKALTRMANLYPALAKRHYYETGTFRWMDVALCPLKDAKRIASSFSPKNGEFGIFLLAIADQQEGARAISQQCSAAAKRKPWPVVVGAPSNQARIIDYGLELLALQAVQKRPELEGDSIARREVAARISTTQAILEEQLRAALANATWHWGAKDLRSGANLSPVASDLADKIYRNAPQVSSELVNRESLSSNSVKARRDLLHRMLSHENEDNLGIEGFPAERGLYETLLKATSVHRKDARSGSWAFGPPDINDQQGKTFVPLWRATRDVFTDPESRVEARDIFSLWSSPPFGLRKGMHPVVLTAFLLAHKGNVAVYKDGVFVPVISDADIDELLQDETRFSLRWITIDEDKSKILLAISKILQDIGRGGSAADPLEAARALVAMVFDLPSWSQRTQRLSDSAKALRDTLMRANDPHKVLFVDLPSILGVKSGKGYVEALRRPLMELATAYEDMLSRIERSMLEALDASDSNLGELRARAETVAQATGDLRQDAFSAHLSRHDGRREQIEAILSLAANKPPRDWSDRDIDAALLEIAQFALRFRQTEALVSVRGRKPNADAFAIVVGAGKDAETFTRQFSLSARHREAVANLAGELADELKAKGFSTEVLLAALARAGMQIADEELEHG